MFKLVIFTSSDQKYADTVIDAIDPNRYISQRLYRFDLSWNGGHVFKDITKIISNIKTGLIVDDMSKYIKHKANFMEITPFYGDCELDNALRVLLDIFKSELKGKSAAYDLRHLAEMYKRTA